jgi:Spy/CpxP family protein refolding chaperone
MRYLSAFLILCLAACASSDDDRPAERPADRPSMRGDRGMRSASYGPMLLDVVPENSWWRDLALAEPLNLTNEQFVALDKIETDNQSEIFRLEQDLPIAVRDLRTAMDADPASTADITTAAQRLRNLRDSLFDRQAQMLAAERVVLTKQQWSTLTNGLQARREQRIDRGNSRGGQHGGRGGYPRGGRGGSSTPWP